MTPATPWKRSAEYGWVLACGVIAVSLLTGGRAARGAEEEGPEVLTRGPVHEAFAEGVVLNPTPGPILKKQPPDPIEEAPPEEKPEGKRVIWIPGYFQWDDDRDDYLWVSGVYRVAPPGRRWINGYWTEKDGGWQYISGFWAAEETEEIVYLPEPPASLEVGPSSPSPSADYFWVPGHWDWRAPRYVWVVGHWSACHDDWIWIPNRYVWTPRGCIFIHGYWDFLVPERGLLFAPVYFSRPIYRTAGYYYRPRVVIDAGFLSVNLFFRPAYRHYCFGDYYAPRYASLGCYPWWNVHYRYGCWDPIYTHHNWYYAKRDPHWHSDLKVAYNRRVEHAEFRPPRTFAEAKTFKFDGQSPRDFNRVAASLNEVAADAKAPLKLVHVDKRSQDELRDVSKRVRNFQADRLAVETKQPKVELKDFQAGGPDLTTDKGKLPKIDLPGRGDNPLRDKLAGEDKSPGGKAIGDKAAGDKAIGDKKPLDLKPGDVTARDNSVGGDKAGKTPGDNARGRNVARFKLPQASELGGEKPTFKSRDNNQPTFVGPNASGDGKPNNSNANKGTAPGVGAFRTRNNDSSSGRADGDRPKLDLGGDKSGVNPKSVGPVDKNTPTPKFERPLVNPRPKSDGPTFEPPKVKIESPKVETPKVFTPKVESPKKGAFQPSSEAPRVAPRFEAPRNDAKPARFDAPSVSPAAKIERAPTPAPKFERPTVVPRVESRPTPSFRSESPKVERSFAPSNPPRTRGEFNAERSGRRGK